MGDLEVPTDDLNSAASNLRYVATQLEAAGDASRQGFREIVGHDLLAKRLDSFAGNWDKRRKEMIESVEALGEVASAAAETFTELETEFVKVLREGS
jgi:hypothetical protein